VCYTDATPSSWSASMLIYMCYCNGAGSLFPVYYMYLSWQFRHVGSLMLYIISKTYLY
jgi:hypothetical protein